MENSEEKKDLEPQKKEIQKVDDQKSKGKKSSKTGLIFLVILLLISTGILGWMYFDAAKKLGDCNNDYKIVSDEKNGLIASLDSLEAEYLSLKSDNDSINIELDEKIAHIKSLKNQVWRAKNASKKEIESLKKEIFTLQEVAKSYIAKVDSLNTLNKRLQDSNLQLMEDISEAQKVDEEKTKQLEDLAAKMEKASVLKASSIISLPLGKKSKPSFKAKKVTKIKTSGTLLENPVVEAGEKTIYVRITRNDGVVLAANTTNVFKFEDEDILYSEKREVSYNNSDLNFDIFYEANDDITKGSYKVTLFCEGKEIGQTNFILN